MLFHWLRIHTDAKRYGGQPLFPRLSDLFNYYEYNALLRSFPFSAHFSPVLKYLFKDYDLLFAWLQVSAESVRGQLKYL